MILMIMGIFRYDSKYAAPTKEQRERYMRGEREEHAFGKEGEITLVIYDEAAYLKDETDGVRILFTGIADKGKVHDELRRMLEEHEQKAQRPDEFRNAGER
jgi:hypothetical protein